MNIEVSRRQFMKLSGAGAVGTALGAFGFAGAEEALAQSIRPFKLAKTTETRNTCPYCSVACGIIMYSNGDVKKGEKAEIVHIEGDPDHPVNRDALPERRCAVGLREGGKRARKEPMVREAGSKEWKPISWDDALDRIAKLMKVDRDANFVAANKDGRDGQSLDDDGIPRCVCDHERNRLHDL